jgi:hypothetical protein
MLPDFSAWENTPKSSSRPWQKSGDAEGSAHRTCSWNGSTFQKPDFAITVDSATRPGPMDHLRDAWQQREAIV